MLPAAHVIRFSVEENRRLHAIARQRLGMTIQAFARDAVLRRLDQADYEFVEKMKSQEKLASGIGTDNNSPLPLSTREEDSRTAGLGLRKKVPSAPAREEAPPPTGASPSPRPASVHEAVAVANTATSDADDSIPEDLLHYSKWISAAESPEQKQQRKAVAIDILRTNRPTQEHEGVVSTLNKMVGDVITDAVSGVVEVAAPVKSAFDLLDKLVGMPKNSTL